jgi:uncharacterized membrane protein
LNGINLAFLFAVTILPFSTRLLASFIAHRTALIVYWANVCLLGLFLYACWIYSKRARLIKDDISDELQAVICRRILFAQSLYALGAALCIFSTYLSIGFIVLIQLNYAFAPGYGRAK